MSYYALRGIDHALIKKAKAQARAMGFSLDEHLRAAIETLARAHDMTVRSQHLKDAALKYDIQHDRMVR